MLTDWWAIPTQAVLNRSSDQHDAPRTGASSCFQSDSVLVDGSFRGLWSLWAVRRTAPRACSVLLADTLASALAAALTRRGAGTITLVKPILLALAIPTPPAALGLEVGRRKDSKQKQNRGDDQDAFHGGPPGFSSQAPCPRNGSGIPAALLMDRNPTGELGTNGQMQIKGAK